MQVDGLKAFGAFLASILTKEMMLSSHIWLALLGEQANKTSPPFS